MARAAPTPGRVRRATRPARRSSGAQLGHLALHEVRRHVGRRCSGTRSSAASDASRVAKLFISTSGRRAPVRSRSVEHLARDDVEERQPVLDLQQRLGPGHAHARAQAAVELEHDGAGRARRARRVVGGQVVGVGQRRRPARCSSSGEHALARRRAAARSSARTCRSRRRRSPRARIFSTLAVRPSSAHGRDASAARRIVTGPAPARQVGALLGASARRSPRRARPA